MSPDPYLVLHFLPVLLEGVHLGGEDVELGLFLQAALLGGLAVLEQSK